VAVAIVGRALVRILEDLVGLVELLELVLAILVARIAVGMMLHRELAKRGLDLRVVRRAFNAEGLVKIALRHLSALPARARTCGARRRAAPGFRHVS
jgi:hypothetical protein